MAKRIFNVPSFTPTATADNTVLADNTFMALRGGSATQRLDVLEILCSGMAPSVSSPTLLEFCRGMTAVATTPTALAAPASEGPMDPATALLAAVPIPFTASAANPKRSNAITDARLNVGLNAYGGILKWFAFDRQSAWGMLGNAVGFGENILSAFTGGTVGLIAAHIIYEPA